MQNFNAKSIGKKNILFGFFVNTDSLILFSIANFSLVTGQGQGQGDKIKKVCLKNENLEADLTSPLPQFDLLHVKITVVYLNLW